MKIRQRQLPAGWYPETRAEVEAMLDDWNDQNPDSAKSGQTRTLLAGVAPHAGWYFSGRLAWQVWQRARQADVVLVVGGHLPAGSGLHLSMEDEYEVPGGRLKVHSGLLAELSQVLLPREDRIRDNTVEVQLPMLACALPDTPVVCLRAPADQHAIELGQFLADWQASSGLSLFVLGSADLTHYGPDYGFTPAGTGAEGFSWAAANNARIAEAMVRLDLAEVLALAEDVQATCSAGAILAATAFAKSCGVSSGELLELASSADIRPASSVVGYAALGFSRPHTEQ
ncbi:MAG: AmmeMemoRadiSam system protein B [Spirochaetes bacterium]|nr:AmmeMemoRadiSam system protein B [Spirochaetota bacterium]